MNNKDRIYLIIFFVVFSSALAFGFYDHYKNPQFYRAEQIDKYQQNYSSNYSPNKSYSNDTTYYKFSSELPRGLL